MQNKPSDQAARGRAVNINRKAREILDQKGETACVDYLAKARVRELPLFETTAGLPPHIGWLVQARLDPPQRQ